MADGVRHDLPARRGLRVGFPGLAPVRLIESMRASPGDRQGVPRLPGVDSGDLDDLADVVAGMSEGAFQGQRHGMRLPPDRDGLFEVFPPQAVERTEQATPAPLPRLQDFRPAAGG